MFLYKLILNVRNPTVWYVRPGEILIRLRIRAVWSESSLGTFWIAMDAKFLHADNEDSDQITRMRRLIWVFVGRTYQKVRFHILRLKYPFQTEVAILKRHL